MDKLDKIIMMLEKLIQLQTKNSTHKCVFSKDTEFYYNRECYRQCIICGEAKIGNW